jgi:hypothetical protein
LDFGTSYRKSRKVPIKFAPYKSCENNDFERNINENMRLFASYMDL